MKRKLFILVSVWLLLLTACGESGKQTTAPGAAGPGEHAMAHVPATVADWAKGAQLFEGLGESHRKITTSSDEAQKYFDQGLRLLWAFNHDESTRSFAKAAELDPNCAICYWGVALTVGPNYNLPVMIEPRARVAWAAVQEAQKNAPQASPVEQALITALAKRYPSAQPLDPSNSAPVLTAYAQAMKAVAQEYPDDLDVQTLYAESLMNIHAWKLWTADGKPEQGTEEIVATLESVLKHDPQHPGANHYYVHAMEASPHPEKAVAAAERVGDMMPAAGHLVHMPAHIMQRVGRYEDAAEANRKAASADAAYYARTNPPDYYAMYTAHNYQFLAFSAAMEGRQAETLDAVAKMRKAISDDMLLAMPGFDWPLTEEYSAAVRFGRWDDMIAKQPPNPQLPAATGGYLYGRGVALAATGRVDGAITVLTRLEQLDDSLPADAAAGLNSAKDVFAVAIDVLKARIADADKQPDTAVKLLRDAVTREDKLSYDEPSDWFFPVRHLLGAQLLKAGKPADAEAVYREDLRQHPENGWALYGLGEALKAQNKKAEAAIIQKRFQSAWKNADITLKASAF
jgi:tetratricopeptide (TPR) repeat protein